MPPSSATASTKATKATKATEATELERRVRIGLAELTLSRARCANWENIPFAAAVCWMLWGAVNPVWLLAWFAAKVVISALRATTTDRFLGINLLDPLRRLRWLEVLLFLDGAITGLLGTYLLPKDNAVLSVLMVATLMGVAAVALMTLAMHQRVMLDFALPLLVPPLVYQLVQFTELSLYISGGIGFFLLVLLTEGRRTSEQATDMQRLRYATQDMAAQREQALEQAQRSNAAKGQFLATISHEMRTPLHGILGLARELQRADTTTDLLRAEYLQTIERTGEHLLGIINDVLDYSKLESQHLRLQPQPFELAALLNSVRDVVHVSASDKGLTFDLTHSVPAACWVMGDAVRLRQVLLNVVGNAIKFTDQGGVRFLAQRDSSGVLQVDVSDTGPGVPEADRERIFTAFQQLDGSFARRHGGAGLGLTISRELARAMGGDLSCHDMEPLALGATPPSGARFHLQVLLPDVSAPSPQHEAPRWSSFAMTQPGVTDMDAPDTLPMPCRVLLVEDNEVNAMVAQVMLERAGLKVSLAVDGAQAVALATKNHFDLILMDCQMPGLDGFEATARIRASERKAGLDRVPIVALSANAFDGDRERSLAAGMDEHLAKPFTEGDLLAVVQRYLG